MKLIDYIQGERRGTEANRIERDAMTDPFLHEAIEGYHDVTGSHAEAVERLLKAVRKRTESRQQWRTLWWSAAAVAVLGVIATSVYLIPLTPKAPKTQLAKAEEVHPAFETAVPPAVGEELLPDTLIQEEKSPQQKRTMAVLSDAIPVAKDQARISPREEDSTVELETAELLQKSAPIAERTKSVSGRVTDEKGAPLAGVTIIAENTGVTTDSEGRFRVEQLPASGTLSAAYIGYETQQVSLPADASPILIAMKESSLAYDEVVVVGYGTVNKSKLTDAATAKTRASVPTLKESRARFARYLSDNLIPQQDEAGNPVTGTVTASFKVDAQGRPYIIVIIKSLSPAADSEAQRLIRSGPDWPPGEDPVSVTIRF